MAACPMCSIEFKLDRNVGVIHYCPLHAATPELLEAAKAAWRVPNLPFDVTEKLGAAIAKAEGR